MKTHLVSNGHLLLVDVIQVMKLLLMF